jgi:hypothetical protein
MHRPDVNTGKVCDTHEATCTCLISLSFHMQIVGRIKVFFSSIIDGAVAMFSRYTRCTRRKSLAS